MLAEGDFWHYGFLFSPALTIGGGTSEVQRNIIGERAGGVERGGDDTTVEHLAVVGEVGPEGQAHRHLVRLVALDDQAEQR